MIMGGEKITRPFPTKKYGVIYCDPPWKYNDRLDLQGEGAELHYPTMSINEMCNLPVGSIADDDCALFMWVTMPMLNECFKLIESWGFKYKTCAFCWVKTNPKNGTIFKGIGRWVMGNAELCLLATKGSPKRVSKNVSNIIKSPPPDFNLSENLNYIDLPDIIESPRSRHSEKPHEARQRIVKLMGKDIPKIELFSRHKIVGWDSWGNESEGDIIDLTNQKTLEQEWD